MGYLQAGQREIFCHGGADYPWDYLCLVPYNEIYASIRDALLFCILFFLAGIALTFLVCHFLVDRITRRFAKLISQMDQFAKYTPDMVLPVDEFSGKSGRRATRSACSAVISAIWRGK